MGMFSIREAREINELKKTPEEIPAEGSLQFLPYGDTYAEWEEPKPSMSKEELEQVYQNLLEAAGIAETAVSATNRW
jgi:hypothetical protein